MFALHNQSVLDKASKNKQKGKKLVLNLKPQVHEKKKHTRQILNNARPRNSSKDRQMPQQEPRINKLALF